MGKPRASFAIARDMALRNPATSDWLKQAITALENRDPLDAQLDAAYLAKLMSVRADEVLERAQHLVSLRELHGGNVVPFGMRK